MQNLRQLRLSADTLQMEVTGSAQNAKNFARPYYTFTRLNIDSFLKQPLPAESESKATDSSLVYSRAITTARNLKGYIEFTAKSQEGKIDVLRRYKIEWQRKFALSFACFVLFLIGAALGAIIRKGGFGLPFVVSVFFFIVFYMLSITGEKMAKEGVLSAMEGMWFSTIILLPLGLFLFYQANRDSAWLNVDAYLSFIQKQFRRRSSRGERPAAP
jgi:lipopolysaccharide export system permease protein